VYLIIYTSFEFFDNNDNNKANNARALTR